MVAKGLQTRARLLQLEREQAEIDGRLGDTLAQVSRAEQAIGESDAMILKLRATKHTEIAQSAARHSGADFPAYRAHPGRKRRACAEQ